MIKIISGIKNNPAYNKYKLRNNQFKTSLHPETRLYSNHKDLICYEPSQYEVSGFQSSNQNKFFSMTLCLLRQFP